MIRRLIFFILITVVLASVAFYLYDSYNFKNSNKDYMSCLFVFEDETAQEPFVKSFLCRYFPESQMIKIMFVDGNILASGSRRKAKTINEMYFEQIKNSRPEFIAQEIARIFSGELRTDVYVSADISVYDAFVWTFAEAVYKKDDFIDADRKTELIFDISAIEEVFKKADRKMIFKFLKFYKENRTKIKTNINKINLFAMYHLFTETNKLYFADIPVSKTKKGISVNREAAADVLLFMDDKNLVSDKKGATMVEVLNASSKKRLAAKAVDKLRDSGFDIFEWGSINKKYNRTLITDLKGNYESAQKVRDVIGCGNIIFIPQNRKFVDVSVLLGTDCEIFDKLDKIKK